MRMREKNCERARGESGMEFEVVIGLETHVQLGTSSKIFCGASAAYGGYPNEHVDPLTLALPGTLPVANLKVIEAAVMMGLATNCQIRRYSRFARKHYYYPDLPKGYQISQYDEPICEAGSVEIKLPSGAKRVIGLKRIHMEEDAGKNIHDVRTESSLVDLNRAGVPLLEVVTEPDLRSPAEAAEYLRVIRQIVRFLGISDGNMEEGSLRCDANISLRPLGQLAYGTRAEIKNINSFKFVERAIEYEIARQQSVLRGGGTVVQETRLFDSASGTTRSMRGKEESADYRYFPDPDLPPVVVEESWIEQIRSSMPSLPAALRRRLIDEFGLSEYDAEVLTAERATVDYYLAVASAGKNRKLAANWVTTELFGVLKRDGLDIENAPVSAMQLGELVGLIDEGVISGKIGKTVFEEMWSTGRSAAAIVEEKGLRQNSDEGEIARLIEGVLDSNPTQLGQYLAGNERLFPFFVGQVMKATKGMANPQILTKLLQDALKRRIGE